MSEGATNTEEVAIPGSLIEAARNGHVEVVQRLLEAGGKVDKADEDGRTALIVAALEGHGEVVRQLLKGGGDVNQAMQDGATPLFIAARNGHVNIVQQLLKAGAEVDKDKKDGATSLFIAAWNGHVEVVQLLLKAGAEVNKSHEDEITPLYIAAQDGHVEVVQQLLKAGAEMEKAQRFGAIPLSVAAFNGHVAVIQQLMDAGSEVDRALPIITSFTPSQNGATPLFLAAENGQVGVVQQLLKAGSDVNKAKQDDGVTSLMMAAHKGYVEVVQELLKAGAEVDTVHENGATPLCIAAQNGHVEVVQQLLMAGAEADKAILEYTSLYIAALNGHVEVVQELLKAGADVDNATQKGATPLFIAAQKGHAEVVQQLLKAGAEVDKDKKDVATPLYTAAINGHVEVVQQLLKAGADVDKDTEFGLTPLYIAAQNGYVEVLQQLLNSGARVDRGVQGAHDKMSYEGLTALHVACMNGHFEVARILILKKKDAINHKATLNIFDFTEEYTDVTPLHIAAALNYLNIVNLLASAEADIACTGIVKNKESGHTKVQSSYDVAVDRGHHLTAFTLWSANLGKTASKQAEDEFPTELSSKQTTIKTRQQAEKAIVRTIITTVLSEHVGRRWRELGRRLGITDVELDDTERRCNINLRGLKEMTVESLQMWLDRQPYWPNIFDVWWALQDMRMGDVADMLLKALTDERNLTGVKDEIEENNEEDDNDDGRNEDQTKVAEKKEETGEVVETSSKSFFERIKELLTFISSPVSNIVSRWMRDFEFDAFVSANQRDFSWVNEWVQQLESPPHNLKICVHHRDFKSGVPISHNIDRAVANSRKILIVLSQNFLSSNWCKVELKAAIEKELSSDKYCVLPMLKSECEIPDELAHLTYLDCKDGTVDVARLASDIKSNVKKEVAKSVTSWP
ncbi:ankyrin repeat domain-containing protein 50-like [Branchiostoma lanceolatum]|uniref:ankyrin repeat domain-containing protein 50-like n=1 Tax=Branchiostoma lanceolatum TaxID=7740 RepID=UPI0034532B4B